MGWIVLLVIVGIVLVFISTYNRLVTARNAFKNAFAQIDVQLTRRYDLIPNLVETVKGYIKHERETLEAVIKARNAAYAGLKTAAADPGNATAVQQLSGADQQLGGALGRLMAVAEAYPGPESQPEHDAVVGRADLDREQGRVRAAGLQRFGDEPTTTRGKCSRAASWPACSISSRRARWRSRSPKRARLRRSALPD